MKLTKLCSLLTAMVIAMSLAMPAVVSHAEDALAEYAQNRVGAAYEMEDTLVFAGAGVTGFGGGSIDNEVYYSGNGSLKVTNKSRYNPIFNVNKEVKEGSTYVMSFRIKNNGKLSSLWMFAQKYFTTSSGKAELILNQNVTQYIDVTDEWQYVSIPITLGSFHDEWASDTATIEFMVTPCHQNGYEVAANIPEIYIDTLSFREVPAETGIALTHSACTTEKNGTVKITNTYNSQHVSTDNLYLNIDSQKVSDVTAVKTVNAAENTATVEITCKNVGTGTHSVEVVMHDVWDNAIKNTLSVDVINYFENLAEAASGCESAEDLTLTVGDRRYSYISTDKVSIDTNTYHSGKASIHVNSKTNYSDIAQVHVKKLQLDKKYIFSVWTKRESDVGAGVHTYYRMWGKGTHTPGTGMAYGKTPSEWNKTSCVIDTAKVATTLGVSDVSEVLTSVLLTPYGAASGVGQSLWVDDIECYMIPGDDEYVSALESVDYVQNGNTLNVMFTFNSETVADANEYITVDGTKTDAALSFDVSNGKTVITATINGMTSGRHTVAFSGLEDMWRRSISASTNVVVIEPSKNLLSAIEECEDLNSFGWYTRSNGEIVTDTVYSGTAALKITSKGIQELNQPASDVPMKDNTTYTYSLMIKTDGTVDRMYIYRNYYTAAGNQYQRATPVNLEMTDEWQKVEFTFNDDIAEKVDNIVKGNVMISQMGGHPERTFYIDKIELYASADMVKECYVKEASAVASEGKVSVSATISSNLSGIKPAVAIIGVYDGDKLAGIKTVDITLAGKNPVEINEDVLVDTNKTVITELAVWDNLEDMNPYMNSAKIN